MNKNVTPIRKLTAIMFIHIADYSVLMHKDERKTHEMVDRQRDLIKPLVVKHSGEVLRYIGDGTLVTFDSAIEAVYCAVEIQEELKNEDDLNLRIGIHIGDIVFDGDDIYGDGVNVASRIEPLAKPGGICVSNLVYENIKNQSGLTLKSVGRKSLKNVGDQIEVFAVTSASEKTTGKSDIPRSLSISSRVIKIWVGVTAVIAALVIVGLKIDFGTVEVVSKDEIDDLSIAVLPFTNLSADPENEFFADGITEDILTNLSKIKNLKVISRTSIMQYKNSSKSMKEIGKELAVAWILEGSVRRGGNRVRITAQLIDTETDKHFWADMYDRDLDDIFALQSDIAIKIATALKALLTPEQEMRINEKPTESVEAYDYYLRGNVYSTRGSNKKDFDIAIKMYKKAIELDPNFTLAYTRLSTTNSYYYWEHFDRSEERLEIAKEAADKALQINFLLPETHLALGMYYYHGRLDYQNALKEFTVAKEMGLISSDLYANIGYVQRRQGKMEQALDNILKAVELNPRDADLSFNLAETYGLLRNYSNAETFLNKSISMSPDLRYPYYLKSLIALRWKGDIERARAVFKKAEQTISFLDNQEIIRLKYLIELYERRYQTALDLIVSSEIETYANQFYFINKYHIMADTYGLMGEDEYAQSYYDSARIDYESSVKEYPEDSRFYTALGLVYAGLGRKEEAVRFGKEGVALLPISEEALRGAYRLEDLAVIYTSVGEHDIAIDHLETLLSIPFVLSKHLLRLDPKWDPLRGNPRFIALLEE